MKIKPLGERVLVKAEEVPNTTKGGILLPEVAKELPQKGQVLAVGPGKLGDDSYRIPMSVNVGDRVLFRQYAGSLVKDLGDDVFMMSEQDIMGIISE